MNLHTAASIGIITLLVCAVFNVTAYETACQRIQIDSTFNIYFDIDYFIDSKTNLTMFRVSYPIENRIETEIVCNGKLLSLSNTTNGANNVFYRSFHYMRYVKVKDYIFNYNTSESAMNMTFEGVVLIESEFLNFTKLVTLTPEGYERQGCNDGYNLYFVNVVPIQFYSLVFASHVIRPSLSIPFALLLFLLSRGELSKGRRIYAVISNLAIIFCSLVDLVHFAVLVGMAKKRGINIYNYHAYYYVDYTLRVISALSFQIALGAYAYRNYRYFHIRIMYRILSRRDTAQESRLTKWLLSRTAFRTLYTITWLLFQVIVIGLTVGVIYLSKSKRLSNIRPVIDIQFYFTIYNISSIAMLICILSIVGVSQVKLCLTKGLKNFFIESDPLLFRLEIYILMFLLPLCITLIMILFTFTPKYLIRIYANIMYVVVQFIVGNGIIGCIELSRIIKKYCCINKNKKQVTRKVQHISTDMIDEELIGVFRKYCIRRQMYKNYQLVTMWKALEMAKSDGRISYQQFLKLLNRYHRKFKFSFPSRMAQHCNDILEHYEDKEYIEMTALEPLYNYVFKKVMDAYEHFPESNEFQNHMAMRQMLRDEFDLDTTSESIYSDYQLMTQPTRLSIGGDRTF
jgi:ABC-type methionine transport system permease subunit